MSRKLVNTEMEGWDGPVDVNVNSIHDALESFGTFFSYRTIEKMFGEIENFEDIFRPTTGDGYEWFWAVKFQVDDGFVAIFLPWFQDFTPEGKAGPDRQIAIYTQGEVSQKSIEKLIAEFAQSILEWNKEKEEEWKC